MNERKKSISTWDKVAPSFGKVGPKYWNTFGHRLVELSSISTGARVLDIGMGRGASLFPAIDKVGKTGYVIGIDNSEVMVAETCKEIIDRNICNTEVIKMNALNLEFEGNSFDNIICGFGIGYLLSADDKLKSLLKLLKNGGQAGFSIWGIQNDQVWLTELVNKYLQPMEKNKNDKKSINEKFDTVEDIVKTLSTSGFKKIKAHQENSEVIYTNKEEWWEEMNSNAVRSTFEQIWGLGSDVFAEFKKDVFKGLDKFYKDGKLCFNMPVIYAFGEKVF